MNPEHAIDICADAAKKKIIFLRRRDDAVYVLEDSLESKKIGHAVFEGLEPKSSNKLPWKTRDDNFRIDGIEGDIVVVLRNNRKTIVVTPFCEWGKAPDIILRYRPTYAELGEAVLKQIAYSSERRSASRVERCQ